MKNDCSGSISVNKSYSNNSNINNNNSNNNSSDNNNNSENNSKKLKISNCNNNKKKVVLSNILIIKILEYAVEQSLKEDSHFILYNNLSTICKTWSFFILPKLNFKNLIFKNDDYIYTYLKVRDQLKYFSNMDTETSYILCDDCFEVSKYLTLIQSPTCSNGTYEVCNHSNQINNNSGNGVVIDYNIYIDDQECGTIFSPNLRKIERLELEYNKNNNSDNNFDCNDNSNNNNSFSINSPRVRVPFFGEQHQFLNKKTKQNLESFNYFEIELSKIHIHKENSNYDYRFNKELKKYQIGIYMLALGVSSFEGGEFIISDSSDKFIQEIKVDTTPHESINNFYNFNWFSFNNDCSHVVKPIRKGTRLLLEFRIVISNPRFIKFKDDQANLREFYEYKEPLQYSIKEQFYTLNYKYGFIDKYLNTNYLYLDSAIQSIKDLMNDRDVNVGVILNHFYKANVSESELKTIDLAIWESFKKGFSQNRVYISSFLIGENWTNRDIDGEEDDEYLNIKISRITSKEINQLSAIGKSSKKTLMFCSGSTNTFQSIFKTPRGLGDVYDHTASFSAIVINK